MSWYLILLFLILIPAALSFMPVRLLRRHRFSRSQDRHVSSGFTEWRVIQNAFVANSLRLAMFVPLFSWGANGDLWPAITATLSFLLGMGLIQILHRPLLGFVADALGVDGAFTMSALVAQRHGKGLPLQIVAAVLTIVALGGLMVIEMLAVGAILMAATSGDSVSTSLVVTGLLSVAAVAGSLSGNSGAMQSNQLELGILYLALFLAIAFLIYLLASEIPQAPPAAILAVFFVAVCCVAMPIYRRIRYVDTGPLGTTDIENARLDRKPRGSGLLVTFEKILNVTICVFSGLAAGLAMLELAAEGFSGVGRSVVAAVQTGPTLPAIALAALFLQPLFHPIVDIGNWQRLAAYQKDQDSAPRDQAPPEQVSAFKRFWRLCVLESPLMWMFFYMFGAIAAVSTEVPGGVGALGGFVQTLTSEPNIVTTTSLLLFLAAVLTMALSTLISQFSASLATIRYDLLAAIWPPVARAELLSSRASPAVPPTPSDIEWRRTRLIAGGLLVAVAVGYYAGSQYIDLTATSFLALLFAFSSLQLAFVPLVLAGLVGRSARDRGMMSPRWALATLCGGAAAAIASISTYVATGREVWLWATVPACIGCAVLLFALSRIWPEKRQETA